ncbi:hypothetical protein Ddc_12573 [Ditylenchus destructor]|nr:hypothetical protein Ddc_12573 [Ditylenchus destructor]
MSGARHVKDGAATRPDFATSVHIAMLLVTQLRRVSRVASVEEGDIVPKVVPLHVLAVAELATIRQDAPSRGVRKL